MMRGRVAVLALMCACSKSSSRSGGSLLAKLAGPATIVAGMNRIGSEEKLASALASAQETVGRKVPFPPCTVELLAKVEQAALVVDLESKTPDARFAVRGAGLRPAVEACLQDFGVQTGSEGRATFYQLGNDKVHLLWLDDTTVLGGPTESAAATAALADVTAPVDRDEHARALLGHVDTGAAFWFVADTTVALKDEKFAGPRPELVQGTVDAQDFTVRAHFATDEEATQAAALVDGFIAKARATPQAGALADAVRVAAKGREAVGALAYAKMVSAMYAGNVQVPPEMAPVFGVGLIAAVAIPAFVKNTKQARSSEAAVNVKRLYDGAFVVYNAKGKLPASTPITPPLGSCCGKPDDRCPADPELWDTPGWKALRFDVEEPHEYSYEFRNEGDTFVARAFGDLNCNGVYSTFELRGTIAGDGSVSTAPMRKDKELE